MDYVTFLRGINISGKNKIAMSDLKEEFEKLGFSNVSTYLNSGNVRFSSEHEDKKELRVLVEETLQKRFGYDIPVYIIETAHLRTILEHAPSWWGTSDKEKYDNLIFILSEDTPKDIENMVGPASEGLEMVQSYGEVLFWTFEKATYQKCNWWKKTATSGIAEKLTIRTGNTVKKTCS